MIALVGLLVAAITAATLIPAQPKKMPVVLIPSANHPIWLLLAVVTSGNVRGSALNFGPRGGFFRFADGKFPVSKAQMERPIGW